MTAMAHLFVNGHDLDFRRCSRRGPRHRLRADIPPTRFKRKPHWLDAHFSGDSSAIDAGNHVATRTAGTSGSTRPGAVDGFGSPGKPLPPPVLPDATLTAFEQRAIPGEGAPAWSPR